MHKRRQKQYLLAAGGQVKTKLLNGKK